MVKKTMKKLLVIFTFFLFAACSVEKPEGPAERIGKGVDEIMGGVRDLDDNDDSFDSSTDRRGHNEDRRDYSQGRSRREFNSRNPDWAPECDPKYDPDCHSDYWGQKDENEADSRHPRGGDESLDDQDDRHY